MGAKMYLHEGKQLNFLLYIFLGYSFLWNIALDSPEGGVPRNDTPTLK